MNHIEIGRYEIDSSLDMPADRFLARVEQLLGHDLDGNQNEDGYSLDGAVELMKAGWSAERIAETFQDVRPSIELICQWRRIAQRTARELSSA